MSIAFGLDPLSLLQLDGRMFDALERAAVRAIEQTSDERPPATLTPSQFAADFAPRKAADA